MDVIADIKVKRHQLADWVSNSIGRHAETTSGFLNVLIGLRFGLVLLVMTWHFGVLEMPMEEEATARLLLWIYLFYTVVLLFLAVFQADWFAGPSSRNAQLIVDTVFSLIFYFQSGSPNSDAFLTLIIPMLLLIKLFRFRDGLLFILFLTLTVPIVALFQTSLVSIAI